MQYPGAINQELTNPNEFSEITTVNALLVSEVFAKWDAFTRAGGDPATVVGIFLDSTDSAWIVYNPSLQGDFSLYSWALPRVPATHRRPSSLLRVLKPYPGDIPLGPDDSPQPSGLDFLNEVLTPRPEPEPVVAPQFTHEPVAFPAPEPMVFSDPNPSTFPPVAPPSIPAPAPVPAPSPMSFPSPQDFSTESPTGFLSDEDDDTITLTAVTGEVYSVGTVPTVFGRSVRESDVSLGTDPSLSRKHVLLQVISGQLYLTDLGSANGTYIGNTRVEPQQMVKVEPRSLLRLGRVHLHVEDYGV